MHHALLRPRRPAFPKGRSPRAWAPLLSHHALLALHHAQHALISSVVAPRCSPCTTLAAPFSLVSHLAPSSFAPRSPCTSTLHTRSSLPSLHHAALLAPRSPCTTVHSLCTMRFFRTKPLAHHAHHASSWSLPHRRAHALLAPRSPPPPLYHHLSPPPQAPHANPHVMRRDHVT